MTLCNRRGQYSASPSSGRRTPDSLGVALRFFFSFFEVKAKRRKLFMRGLTRSRMVHVVDFQQASAVICRSGLCQDARY